MWKDKDIRVLKKILFILFFTALTVPISIAQENQFAGNESIAPINSSEPIINNASEETFPSPIKITNATAEIERVNGIRIITVRQNNDLQYNIGYAIGTAIIKDDKDYPVRLRKFLDTFNNNESTYQLDIVVKIISKSTPCWFKQQLQGLADSLCINEQKIKFSFEDILILNTVALWKKLPRKTPNQPPPAPTSIVPIVKTDSSIILLSPDSETRDQSSVITSTVTPDAGTVIARSYQRNNYDFFDNYPAITIYHLDNSSFINVGFEGLLACISVINSNGISINPIQYSDPKTIEIIGNTPPTIIARTAIESCKNIDDCQEYLKSQVSVFKQSFIISDGKRTLKIDTHTDNSISKNTVSDVTGQNFLLTDFTDARASHDILKTINTFRNTVKTYNMQDIKELYRTYPLLNYSYTPSQDNKRSVFNVIFNSMKKEILVITKNKGPLDFENKYTSVKFKQ